VIAFLNSFLNSDKESINSFFRFLSEDVARSISEIIFNCSTSFLRAFSSLFILKSGQRTDIVIKKRGCGLVAQNDIRRSLFHNEAGSLAFVIVTRM
jgi:hypothetical protein